MGRRTRRSFTKEYKAEVVRLVKTSGKSIGQMAKQLDLTETAVRAWVRQAAIDEKRDPLGPLTYIHRSKLTERANLENGEGSIFGLKAGFLAVAIELSLN